MRVHTFSLANSDAQMTKTNAKSRLIRDAMASGTKFSLTITVESAMVMSSGSSQQGTNGCTAIPGHAEPQQGARTMPTIAKLHPTAGVMASVSRFTIRKTKVPSNTKTWFGSKVCATNGEFSVATRQKYCMRKVLSHVQARPPTH